MFRSYVVKKHGFKKVPETNVECLCAINIFASKLVFLLCLMREILSDKHVIDFRNDTANINDG